MRVSLQNKLSLVKQRKEMDTESSIFVRNDNVSAIRKSSSFDGIIGACRNLSIPSVPGLSLKILAHNSREGGVVGVVVGERHTFTIYLRRSIL
jgi:hypothetical protein